MDHGVKPYTCVVQAKISSDVIKAFVLEDTAKDTGPEDEDKDLQEQQRQGRGLGSRGFETKFKA